MEYALAIIIISIFVILFGISYASVEAALDKIRERIEVIENKLGIGLDN